VVISKGKTVPIRLNQCLDAVPINFPTHAHGQGYMDLNGVIPELIDYVTFRKGPYYAEVGDFSSAGTAAFHLVKTLPEGLAKVGIGQDDYYRVLVAQTPKIGPGHLLYAFEANMYNGPWDHHEHVRKFNGVLTYTLTRGPSTFSLGFAAYSNTWDATDQIPQRAIDQGLISRLGTIDPSDGGRTSRFSLSSEWSYKGNTSLRRCLTGVDSISKGLPEFVSIDEEPNHEIVHALRLGEAQRAADEPFNPRPQIDVFALDFLRVLLAHLMLLSIQMPRVGPPAVGVKLRDTKGCQ
jgi:hypothetical protein